MQTPGRMLRAALIAAAVLCAVDETARAASAECTVAAAQRAAPQGMTIGDIPDMGPGFPAIQGGVGLVPAGALWPTSPEVCLVTGTVVTNTADGKTANFGVLLPAKSSWNRKFMYDGCGGNCGAVFAAGPPAVDQMNKGYPLWASDDGHNIANPTWPLSGPGQLDRDAIVDFAYRAVHAVIAAGKKFTERYFDEPLRYAYYAGCSDGGREGMVEVNRYPEDFDGVLVGDPYFDVPGQNLNVSNATVQLRSSDASLAPPAFALATGIVLASCDAVDGVADGLIQNPAACHFDPRIDLPRCPGDVPGAGCFTQAQSESLSSMIAATTDPAGRVIHPGYPVSDMFSGFGANLGIWAGVTTPPSNLTGPQPWPNGGAPAAWSINDPLLADWVFSGDPAYNSVTTLGLGWRAGGPGAIDFFHTVAPFRTIERVYSAMNVAAGDFPENAFEFIRQDRKLLMYHGLSDGFITPYRTMQYYKKLADLNGGYHSLQQNVALFAVPGMYHCNGGPGPNNFGQPFHFPGGFLNVFNTYLPNTDAHHDAQTALERWVEQGVAPDYLVASKYPNDDPTQPAARTMPLCRFPAQARFTGSGTVTDAANWTCPPDDESMLDVGLDGIQAGVQAPLWPLRQRE
jgi:hypothetical protein